MKLKIKRGPFGLFLSPENDKDKTIIDLIYDNNYPKKIKFNAHCDEGILRCDFVKNVDKLNVKTQFRKEVKTVAQGKELKIEVYFAKQDKKKPRHERRVAVHIDDHTFLLNEQQIRKLGWKLVSRAFDKTPSKISWPPIRQCRKCGHVYKPWDNWDGGK